MILSAYTDGASRGNPGHAGIGIIVKDETGSVVFTLHEYLGNTTNNVAEYTAFIRCLQHLKNILETQSFTEIVVHTDSELMERQLNGKYKVKDENLKKLYVKAKMLIMSLPIKVTITHILRSFNKEADILANKAIDEHLKL
jgi:ribonuclease HI